MPVVQTQLHKINWGDTAGAHSPHCPAPLAAVVAVPRGTRRPGNTATAQSRVAGGTRHLEPRPPRALGSAATDASMQSPRPQHSRSSGGGTC
eukprot:5673793-Karenia_brevis.AAC.1